MLGPLVVLAILSVVGGWVGIPAALFGHNEIEHFLEPVFGAPAETASGAGFGLERGLAAVSVAIAALGIFIAWRWYYKRPGGATRIAKAEPLYGVLENKYWVDEFYNGILVTGLLMATRVMEMVFDGGVVNGSGWVSGAVTRGMSSLVRKQISGNIRSYAGWLAIGAAVVLTVMVFGRVWNHW
jgi:NADH-quinone oxidoreductase subunit L